MHGRAVTLLVGTMVLSLVSVATDSFASLRTEDPCRLGSVVASTMETPEWTFAEIVQRSRFVAIVEPRSAEFTPILGPLLLDGKTHAIAMPYTTFDATVIRTFVGDERSGEIARVTQEGSDGYCIDPAPSALMTLGERYLITSLDFYGRPGEYRLFPYDAGYIRIESAEQERRLTARIEGIVESRDRSRRHPSRVWPWTRG
jgi:hypothetical protein